MIISKKDIAKIFVASMLLTGCTNTSGPNFEKDADAYFQKKDYLKAIEYYQKSLKQNPKDEDIKLKLEKVKTSYVEYKITELEMKLNKNNKTIDLVKSLYTSSDELKIYGNENIINSFQNKLEIENKNLEDDIKVLKQSVLDYKENGEFDKLINTLNKIVMISSEFKNSDFFITHFADATNYYYNKVVESLDDAKLENAESYFSIYKKIASSNDKIASLELLINEYSEIEKLINTIESNIIQENYKEALVNVLNINERKTENKKLQDKINQVSSKVAKEFLNLAQRYIDEENIADAYFELLNASKIKASVKYTSVGKNILNKLYDKAKDYTNMELEGVAFALYDYIKDIDSNYKSIFVLQRDIKDRIMKKNVLKLAISEFVTPDLNRNSGTRFTASLTSQLFKNSTDDLKVIERNRLKLILDELKLQETGNIETLAQQRGKIKGINIFVFGDIVESSIDPQRVETKVSKKIQIGTRKVSNPMFMIYLSKPQMERDSMKMPEQFIEEPEYQIISYNEGKIRKTANLIVSVRVVNIQKGEIIEAKTFEKQRVVEDKYNEGVEFAGIISDPENIESDKTIMADLQKELINEISEFVLNSFKDREKKALEKVDYYVERREYPKAMEEIIDSKVIADIKNIAVDMSIIDKQNSIFRELVK